MGLLKAATCVAVLLVIYCSLENQEVMETKESYIHSRDKRQTILNSSEYVLEIVLSISNLESLRTALNTLDFPLMINGTDAEIISIETTTVCSPSNTNEYECRCEQPFAFPLDSCTEHGACDAIIGDTCGCISALPADGQSCQLNTSQTEPMESVIVVDLSLPRSSLPLLRNTLSNIPLPYNISLSLQVLEINFTTACFLNSTGGLQCQCEEQFAWPCDKCDVFGPCSSVTGPVCECINGPPPDGEYCEPITSIDPCPTPTLEPMESVIVVDLSLPRSSLPLLRNTLSNIPLPYTISLSLQVLEINFTTACFLNSTGGLQCQCEEQFAWPCDKCDVFGPCSSVTGPVCECINGPPPDGEYCEPITSINPCPTPTPGIISTLRTTINTTMMPLTIPVTTPTTIPVTTTTTIPVTTPTTIPVTTTTTIPVTTPTTIPVTTTTTIPVTTIIIERTLSFVLDIEYLESYNNPSNEVFINANRAIQTQCEEHVSTLQSPCQLSRFRPGSTIGEYTLRAASLPETDIQALKTGLFLDLSDTYPIISESQSSLTLNPPTVISEEEATVTCGPPPADLELGTNWEAEWRLNDKLITPDDLHVFSKEGGKAILTLKRFFGTDIGQYECRLKSGQKIFRERSNQLFKLQERPLIQLLPASRQIHCDDTEEVQLQCSVNEPYTVQFLNNLNEVLDTGNPINYLFRIPNCENTEQTFTCRVTGRSVVESKATMLQLTTGDPVCNDEIFGTGDPGDRAVSSSCGPDKVGERIGVCQTDRSWKVVEDNCILQPVQELLQQSEFLNPNSLPGFLVTLRNVTVNFTEEVVESPANINAIVDILNNVATISLPIDSELIEDILFTAGVLTTDGARASWESLNDNNNNNTSNVSQTGRSSAFLQSLETITSLISSDSLAIETPFILLNKTTFTDFFNESFNSSVTIVISEPEEGENNITVMTFASMNNVLPARDEANSSIFEINGRVVLVQTSMGNSPINNINFTFQLLSTTLVNPQCVFWNFSLFDGRGGWDTEGCMSVESQNGSVTCNCNHLTSFSILMSPFVNCDVCSVITYVGVGISMASLVICLIIEAIIWRKIRRNTTSYLRHVSIVNIAVSLLIADIWFIIGASIAEAEAEGNRDACSAATFFVHFFYLAMFFWMLASALLLLYRTVSVFDGGLSKRSMLAIGFSLGYGGPIIIAVITIAVTAPDDRYRQDEFCWLNFDESLAIIAFVLPALTIVLINLIILIVVLYKMLRRRAVADSAQAGQRNVLLVIVRTLAVLTPLFGLTWGLGIGTLVQPEDEGIHIAFSFFNSLQGFFILVFGLLLDKKVRSEIAIKSQISGSGTRTTSAGNSSSGFGFLRLWRRGRDGYNISSNDSNVTQSLNT